MMAASPTACVTYLMAPTDAADFNTFHSWSCGETRSTIMVLQTISGDLPPDSGGVSEPQTSTKREIVRVTSSTGTYSLTQGGRHNLTLFKTPCSRSPARIRQTHLARAHRVVRAHQAAAPVIYYALA